ncbi:MAG: Txe/YoeB family addiction module toxin [Mogibacterium sp.]|nr:Txe/YoeB family addiction module toxin [Mogibacterium sp.]
MSNMIFTDDGLEDYIYWQTQDKKNLKKINRLLKSIQQEPFSGEGKPEPLKNREGDWSRRINETDRLVYRIEDGDVLIKQCKGHYDD